MPAPGWTSISLKKELVDLIDRYIESAAGKELGFVSRTDVVTYALRRYIDFLREYADQPHA